MFTTRYRQTCLYLETPIGILLPRDQGQCVARLEGQIGHYWLSHYPQPPKREAAEFRSF